MLYDATNLIELKKLQKNSVKVKEAWCSEQEADFRRIVYMVDDLVSHAISIGNSSHAYHQLESAKQNFLEEFSEMTGKYRLPIVPAEEFRKYSPE